MPFLKEITIACSYPITTDRIGGMDYFFWEMDQALKQEGYIPTWLFRSNGSTQHYSDKGLNFQVVKNVDDFQEELLVWLETKKETSLFIGHFLDYQSSIVKSIKDVLGNSVACIYVDHMSRPINNPNFSKRIKHAIKGIIYFNQIDQIIAVSNYVKQSIVSEIGAFWTKKTQVIYNGLQMNNYIVVPVFQENQSLAIFCIGHLIPEKGFQTVILSCQLLQEQGIPFHLTIAGDGKYKSNLIDLASQNLASNSFTFLGNITNQSHWLNQSDVVIIPSLWNEAFGFTVVEALLMNKVVFATNVGGIPEILKDKQLLFKPNNHLQLKELLIEYISNKKKYTDKAKKLHEIAKTEFTIEKMISQHLQCYRSFLKQQT
ncbi:MAG: glycosyltransferase family 4 protein [Flavobacterium sp.]